MPYAMRTRNCTGCGEPFTAQMRAIGDVYCIACGIARGAEAIVQMAQKSGPYYDRWVRSGGPRGRPPQQPTGE